MNEEIQKLQYQIDELREILFKKTGSGPSDIRSQSIGVGSAFSAKTTLLGFYGAAATTQQADGAGLTNSVTAGGTTNTIANFTDLSTYATDAATIRNDIYQLARKLKIVDDALRTYGLLT